MFILAEISIKTIKNFYNGDYKIILYLSMDGTNRTTVSHKTLYSVLILILIFSPFIFARALSISEIMYDVPGTDDGREWIEIVNDGASFVDVVEYKLFEANTNHSIETFRGSSVLPVGGYGVIADNPVKFIIDWPNYGGSIFNSTFSLSNTGETLALKLGTSTVVDQVSFNSAPGAAGDGNSLQKINNTWKSAVPTPGSAPSSAVLPSSGTVATTSLGIESLGSSGSIISTTGQPSSVSSFPVDPQIFALAEGDRLFVVGADSQLHGRAWGLKREPLENARFHWNFGDGEIAEGENVLHSYSYPGEYVVVLSVSSAKNTASSRLVVEAVPNQVVVSDVVSGAQGMIELKNNSIREINLSWWLIESAGKQFALPKDTIVLPGRTLRFSAKTTQLNFDSTTTKLLYPNGSVANNFVIKTVATSTILALSFVQASAEPPAVGSSVVQEVQKEIVKTADNADNNEVVPVRIASKNTEPKITASAIKTVDIGDASKKSETVFSFDGRDIVVAVSNTASAVGAITTAVAGFQTKKPAHTSGVWFGLLAILIAVSVAGAFALNRSSVGASGDLKQAMESADEYEIIQ